jgi:hypothetical protein
MATAKTMLMSAAVLLFGCQPTIGDAPGGIGNGEGTEADGGAPGGGSEPEPGPDADPNDPPDPGGGGGGGGGGGDDGDGDGDGDEVTLSQTNSDAIDDGNSEACVELDDNEAPTRTLENSYYRAFDLAAEGIEGDFQVSSVLFGVDESTAPDDSAQPATVRLHILDGDELLLENLDEIASQNIDIAPQELTTLEVPIEATVPAGSTLVFELFVPSTDQQGEFFFIGSNSEGQRAPSFVRAPDDGCDFDEPTDLADIGLANMHVIMEVTGTDEGQAELSGSGTPARAAPRRVSVW